MKPQALITRRQLLARLAGTFGAAAMPWQLTAGATAAVGQTRASSGDEMLGRSAAALSRAIRAGELSSVELVRAQLGRIAAINPLLNAVVQDRAEAALGEARAADAALAAGRVTGPLHGVPFTIKDSFDTAGLVSTAGTLGRASFVPANDATVVARLRAAGGILLGKTNTPELTLSIETDNLVYGRTHNPYDPARSPGGSSGGAAAIIAAWGSPFDIGTDTGGSIRYPAHCCGIAGLKPTSGRVSRAGHIINFAGHAQSLTTVGPLARHLEDLELLLPIIAGPDEVDPHIVPAPLRDPGALDLAGLRVATYLDIGEIRVEAAVGAAVAAAVGVLEEAGATIREAQPPELGQSIGLLIRLFGADGGAGLKAYLGQLGTTEFSPAIATVLEAANRAATSTSEFAATLVALDLYRSRMLAFMNDFDLIVCPTAAHAAPPPILEWREEHAMPPTIGLYTVPYNLTGWPAVVLRTGTTDTGLPVGVQLVARPWREDVALAAARHLEAALGGWQPPDSAAS